MRIKIILLIVSICFSFLSIILFSILKDIPIFSLLFKEYIKNGKSFFVPVIPAYNLVPYFPDAIPVHFTLGHLLDILIIININVYIESSVYHYLKKGLLNNKEAMMFHLIAPIENCPCDTYQSQDTESIIKKDNLMPNFWNSIHLKHKKSYQAPKKLSNMVLNLKYLKEMRRSLKTQIQKICSSFKDIYKRQKEIYTIFLSLLSFLSEYLIENLHTSFLNKKRISISKIIINCEG